MATLPDKLRLGAVALKVADFERALGFYQEVLGLQPERVEAGQTDLRADGSSPLVRLSEVPGARPKPANASGLYHYALLLPDRVWLARSLKRLLDVDYPLQGAADHLVSEAVYLADPDGNGIELYRDRPREEWPSEGDQLRMATMPLDVHDLLAEAERHGAEWSGMPEATRVGHVHLHVPRIPEAEAFYRDTLGFDLMVRYGRQASFLAAGGYHHHVGINTWAGEGAPPPPEDAAGLDHFTIVLPDPDALQALADRLAEAGWPYESKDGVIWVEDPASNRIKVEVEGG